MTVSNHTALYRFTFPAKPCDPDTPLSPLILVDLEDLPKSRTDGHVDVNSTTGRLSGTGTYSPSFGEGHYTAYFCADFSGATVRDSGRFNKGGATGAWTRFETPDLNGQILVRVGISFISVVQACGNAEREIPKFDFNQTLSVAEDAWDAKLSVIKIDAAGVSEELQTTFWSGVYRSMISPQGMSDSSYLQTDS